MEIEFREQVAEEDLSKIRQIVASTGFFYNYEVDVAVELIQDRLSKGSASDYSFVFAASGGETLAYACFGKIGCTAASYDLYWIAVHNDFRGQGIGKELLRQVEIMIGNQNGRRLYIETSSRSLYKPTRIFYENCGYIKEAQLKDFYAPGDDKIIYSREFGVV